MLRWAGFQMEGNRRMRQILELPSLKRRGEFLAAVARSRELHHPWAYPPRTAKTFDAYVKRFKSPRHIGYWVRTDAGELAGVVNISEIVRGGFLSGYLGYYSFVPHHRHGYMTIGLKAVIGRAFGIHRLHRLEANIQPGNESSRRLVQRLGFRNEGFSPRYLKIGGRWRDHERWALTMEDWSQINAD
jgi:ribosomal-protein-alanine N-acetyltransferase